LAAATRRAAKMVGVNKHFTRHMITRDDGWKLLTEFTQSESLRKHALAVEACMRACASKFGGDVEEWGWSD